MGDCVGAIKASWEYPDLRCLAEHAATRFPDRDFFLCSDSVHEILDRRDRTQISVPGFVSRAWRIEKILHWLQTGYGRHPCKGFGG